MDVLGKDRREGLGRKANSRVLLFVLILISGILLLSSLYAAQASVFQKAREGVMDAASPVLKLLSTPIALVQNVVGGVEDYFGALEENKSLREENAQLREWMQEALNLRQQLAAYERLQSYHAPPEVVPIDAAVIGESNEVYTHSMIVNAGQKSGVKIGQAVIDDRGLVGHIVDAGNSASRVLLLTDIQSRIPVYVEEAEVEGILVGRSYKVPEIEFMRDHEDGVFLPGQRVMTSGAGGTLPKGMPIGEIKLTKSGAVRVDLFSDFSRTRMVRVMNYDFITPEEDPAENDPELELTQPEPAPDAVAVEG